MVFVVLHLQDGHVEVARLLLDSGAQVNMPADSFESPLTLAACGGHVELAALLIERGANLEEVNDEGYTPLMEAAREGHEEMVALLLGQGNCCGLELCSCWGKSSVTVIAVFFGNEMPCARGRGLLILPSVTGVLCCLKEQTSTLRQRRPKKPH